MEELGIAAAPALQERRTAADHVADALRSAILSGTLAGGATLNQVALASHFGVSRVPVREAIRRLEAEGLVRADAHRLVTVTGLTAEAVAEIYDLRARLEDYLLREAATASDEVHVAELLALCDRMDAALDRETWLALNREFHRLLYRPAGAEIAESLVDNLAGRVESYLHGAGGVDRTAAAGKEHRQIVRSLARGDVERARAQLARHIEGTRKRVLALFAAAPPAR